MKFAATLVALFAGASLSAAQQITATTPPTAAQSSKIVSDLNSYLGSVTKQADYSTLVSVAQDSLDASVLLANPTNGAQWISSVNALVTGTPTWLTDLPPPQQTQVKSIFSAIASIYNKDSASSGAPAGNLGGKGTIALGAGVMVAIGGVMIVL